MITKFVCLVEGISEKEMLKVILPKLLPPTHKFQPDFIAFSGKPDLKRGMELKIRHYGVPAVFLVLCDLDMGKCNTLKSELLNKVPNSVKGKTKIRIACYELESFYLGDLQAVEKGMNIPNIAKGQNRKKFRTPDDFPRPDETLDKITDGKYQKVSCSKKIAPYLNLNIGFNRSKSFNNLLKAINELTA